MADHALRARGVIGPAATSVAVLAGVSATFVGFLAHEWGHLAGATLSGSVVEPGRSVLSPLLFRFDTEQSSREQFIAMSVGGFAATIVGSALIWWAVPTATLSGNVAIAVTAIAIGVTMIGELPIFARVLRGAPLPTGAIFVGSSPERSSPSSPPVVHASAPPA